MKVLTTIPDEVMERVPVELLECLIDLPDCLPYNTTDWYAVRIISDGMTTDVPGGDLGLITIVDK